MVFKGSPIRKTMTVNRIVSFLPSATELIYELGEQDKVFGVTHECRYPKDADYKPKVINTVIDSEKLTIPINHTESETPQALLAFLAGWQTYVLDILPLMLNQLETQLPPANTTLKNQDALTLREGKSVDDILTEIKENHEQIIDLLSTATPEALTLRRAQGERIFTIKSYVVDKLVDYMLEQRQLFKQH
jgi:hypothetical protein